MLSEKEKLDALATLGIDLNRVQDLDILMERILTEGCGLHLYPGKGLTAFRLYPK